MRTNRTICALARLCAKHRAFQVWKVQNVRIQCGLGFAKQFCGKEFMLAELDKEQASSFHSDALFVQNLKNQIKSVEETLDKLLDAHLDNTITSEEYIAKKQKLLNQKIDFSEKLKDFERKGNRWLELSKQFILDSNQAIIIASEENLETKRDFLKKIGSNPRLASRSLFLDFKNPWRILAETPVASLLYAPNFGENRDSIFWLAYSS